VKFIAAHADQQVGGRRWGVEPICRVLTEHGCPIAPSTYYAARAAGQRPAKRALRDEQLKDEISRVHGANFGVYGARTVWLQLNREGIPVARCTVERLMRELGLAGARRGRRIRTTSPATPRRGLRTWSNATSTRWCPTGLGSRTSPTYPPGPGWST
jgi:putative transposase